ncbi:MAG TPA: hypothetical protein VF717_17000 [Pyrinomonadaceae bacterium]|jgi:hypothetical protein
MAVAICGCALLLTAYAQTGTREDKQDEAALELKLTAYETSVCPDSSLTLSLEITNRGRRQVRFLGSNLWRAFSYSEVGRPRAQVLAGCGGGDPAEKWIVLEPGDKYFGTLIHRLDTNSFFKDAGRYKISTTLNYRVGDWDSETVRSSEAEFEIQDCAAK